MKNRNLKIITIVLALAAWCGPGQAEVYRCTDNSGASTFSDKPCGPDAILVKNIKTQTKREYGFQQYLKKSRQPALPTPPPRSAALARPAAAPNIQVNVAPQVDCPSKETIKQAIRRRTIVACMTETQARSAIPTGITGFNEFQNFDQFGSFTEWRFPVVSNNFPVRIQFRDGQVFGFETLPLRRRD